MIEPPSPKLKKRPERHYRAWIYAAGFAVSLACLFFFYRRIAGLHEGIQLLPDRGAAGLVMAVMAYLLSYSSGAWAWAHLLRLLGMSIGIRVATGIYFTTQFGKYLPGNFAHHIGRVAVAKRHGVTLPIVMTSMLLETGIALIVMLLFSLPVLVRFVSPGPIWLFATCVGALLAGALIWSRRQQLLTARKAATERFNAGLKLTWAVPIASIIFCPLLSGCALLLLDDGFTDKFQTGVYVVSVFCAAWVAGFLTPGAPAGLGIRELILSEGLAPVVGMERAMAAAILLRLVSTIADLIAFGIGLVLLHCGRIGQKTLNPPSRPAPSARSR